MLVFIDESGDSGLKLDAGSSKFFVVTLVAFEDNEEAIAADREIALLRKELGFSDTFEFHFSKLRPDLRERFLTRIGRFEFFYFGIVLNKAKLYGPGFQFKEPFYKYTCGLVFSNAKPYLSNATVIIDGSGSTDFRLQLGNYLRRKINEGDAKHIGKVKIQDSGTNNLLQLADMVCGAAAATQCLAFW